MKMLLHLADLRAHVQLKQSQPRALCRYKGLILSLQKHMDSIHPSIHYPSIIVRLSGPGRGPRDTWALSFKSYTVHY